MLARDAAPASISYDPTVLAQHVAEPACRLEAIERGDTRHAAAARFIEDAYAGAYGTDIRVTYPLLLRLCCPAGATLAAAGMRHARDEPLYFEQVLARPVDRALSTAYDARVRRDQIWELGNMASQGSGRALYLFIAVYYQLCIARADYLVVVATQKLRARCEQLGFGIRYLGKVERMPLPEGQRIGRYIELGQPELLSLDTESLHPAFARLGVEIDAPQARFS